MAQTWAIYSLTAPTGYTKKNQKNAVISRRGAGPMGRRLRALREEGQMCIIEENPNGRN
jgi:hypothetical protein